jgi:hypothetical protein
MRNKCLESRRNFLKASAAGAAGLALVGPAARKATAANLPVTLINLSTTPINTEIDNLRVAYATDPAMMRNNHYGDFGGFNNPSNTTTGVVYSVVKSNMDSLACALANKTDIAQAWATIFKLPTGKAWSAAKAAIKINSIGGDHAAVPIVAKVCEVLIGMGMPAGNICVFDMTQGGAKGLYSTYRDGTGVMKQLPAVVFGGVNADTGQPANTKYTAQFPGGYTMDASTCIDGVDIYVNIGNNKGHDQFANYSGVTMCLKNNFGTVCFGHNGMAQLTASNSCDYIIGKLPTTYPAKQQLCILDSLWLGNVGDYGGGINDGNNTNSIVMGTFAGAVDYVGTMKIRGSNSNFHAGTSQYTGWNQSIVDQFITNFGYTAADLATVMTPQTGAGKGLVKAGAVSISPRQNENQNLSRQGIVQISVSGNRIKAVNTNVYLGKGETVQSAEIFTIQGRKVRTLAVNSGSNHVIWDGRTNSGSLVQAGNYIVRIKGQKTVTSGELVLSK